MTTKEKEPVGITEVKEADFNRLPENSMEELYVKKTAIDKEYLSMNELYRYYEGSNEYLRQQAATKLENLTEEQLKSVLLYLRDFLSWKAKKRFNVDLLQYHAERLAKRLYIESALNDCKTADEVIGLANKTNLVLNDHLFPKDVIRTPSVKKFVTFLTEDGVLDAVKAVLHKVFGDKIEEIENLNDVNNEEK